MLIDHVMKMSNLKCECQQDHVSEDYADKIKMTYG